jgi:protein phosphatase 1 regulatory subunit 12A
LYKLYSTYSLLKSIHFSVSGIDCDEARNKEERIMLEDAKEWLNSGGIEETPHPKTGATALHIAAAKGYIKVMR